MMKKQEETPELPDITDEDITRLIEIVELFLSGKATKENLAPLGAFLPEDEDEVT